MVNIIYALHKFLFTLRDIMLFVRLCY